MNKMSRGGACVEQCEHLLCDEIETFDLSHTCCHQQIDIIGRQAASSSQYKTTIVSGASVAGFRTQSYIVVLTKGKERSPAVAEKADRTEFMYTVETCNILSKLYI